MVGAKGCSLASEFRFGSRSRLAWRQARPADADPTVVVTGAAESSTSSATLKLPTRDGNHHGTIDVRYQVSLSHLAPEEEP